MKIRASSGPRAWFVAAVAVGVMALVPATMSAQTAETEYEASLSGTSEVPANQSTATGTFSATLNATGDLEWTLSVPTITDATAAHLHLGAAGENGPVVVSLFTAPSTGAVDTITTSGTATATSLVGPLAGDFAAFVTALNAGEIYVNVHTTALPAGEIRGQVAESTAGSGDGTLTAPTFGTGNVGAAVFSGGTIAELAAAVTAAEGTAVWVQGTDGNWYRYDTEATGGTAFLNNAFNAQFEAGLSQSAVFVVK